MNTPRIRYQTLAFETSALNSDDVNNIDIHVRSLRDKQQFSDPLGEAEALGISSAQWSLFGVVWESSTVLADLMSNFDIHNKRILEVGCGMALSSLLLNARHADITATDYHPEAAEFLIENVKLNNGKKIPFLRTNWTNLEDGLGTFDLIIGSDLLYEKDHIRYLSEFLNRHAKKSCEIIIVDPGRAQHAAFSKEMIGYGFNHSQKRVEKMKTGHTGDNSTGFKGFVLRYQKE